MTGIPKSIKRRMNKTPHPNKSREKTFWVNFEEDDGDPSREPRGHRKSVRAKDEWAARDKIWKMHPNVEIIRVDEEF